MNTIKYPPILLLILGLFTLNCTTQRVSVLEGCHYDQTKKQTDYFVLPYGSVSLPGKWEKDHYNVVSKQQFFTNSDSISIAIAFHRYDGYEFNSTGQKKGYDFVKAFYEWDSKYFVDTYGLNKNLIEADSLNNYVIYRIFGWIGEQDKIKFNSYFLIGERNGNVSNLSISYNDKWPEKTKPDFLRALYLKK